MLYPYLLKLAIDKRTKGTIDIQDDVTWCMMIANDIIFANQQESR